MTISKNNKTFKKKRIRRSNKEIFNGPIDHAVVKNRSVGLIVKATQTSKYLKDYVKLLLVMQIKTKEGLKNIRITNLNADKIESFIAGNFKTDSSTIYKSDINSNIKNDDINEILKSTTISQVVIEPIKSSQKDLLKRTENVQKTNKTCINNQFPEKGVNDNSLVKEIIPLVNTLHFYNDNADTFKDI